MSMGLIQFLYGSLHGMQFSINSSMDIGYLALRLLRS